MKLTKAQSEALQQIANRDGYFSPWVLGTRTCEALRSRGLVTTSTGENIRFGGRFGYDPPLWITDAGRAAVPPTARICPFCHAEIPPGPAAYREHCLAHHGDGSGSF